MNATTKLLHRKPYMQPVAVLCIVLLLAMQDQNLWAQITSLDVPTAQKMSAPVTTYHQPDPTSESRYVYNAVLEDDYTLRYLVWDSTRLNEVRAAVHNQSPLIKVIVDEESGNLLVKFPTPIADNIQNAVWGKTVILASADDDDPKIEAIWCIVVVLGGLGVGTYYTFKWLCKQAGLIPTNPPPPPPTNPPPPPPRTNKPYMPPWIGHGPYPYDASSGLMMSSLTAENESSVMPMNVKESLFGGTSSTNPLFVTEAPDGSMAGITYFDCSNWDVLYGTTNNEYKDPMGLPYLRCVRSILQSTTSLVPTNEWTSILVMYVWYNEDMQCISIYNSDGDLKENFVVSRGSDIQMESIDYVLTHWWDPKVSRLYRTWSGLPATP